jgi:hypothetical protein
VAEATVIVCDVCGRTPADTIRITARGRNYTKDLCATHLSELIGGARAPRRGRPPKAASAAPSAPRRRGRPPKSASTDEAAAPRRRGRPPKATQSVPASASGRKRGPITDPVQLQKRRDALAKARAARAAKRAAAN